MYATVFLIGRNFTVDVSCNKRSSLMTYAMQVRHVLPRITFHVVFICSELTETYEHCANHLFLAQYFLFTDVPIVQLLNTRLGQSLGKETILECSVTSYPRAKINWYKNGVQIIHSYKFRQELYAGKHDTYILSLQILYINKHDYGDYTCEAENRMGTERSTMVLYGGYSR